MPIFYHISRGEIPEKAPFVPIKIEERNDFLTHFNMTPEFRSDIHSFYGGMVSEHGAKYLFPPIPIDEKNLHADLFRIEHNFELHRRKYFANLTSRFLCYFACLTIEDAQSYRSSVFGGNGKLFQVKCDNYIKADSSFLKVTSSDQQNFELANNYWSGNNSATPVWEVLMFGKIDILTKID